MASSKFVRLAVSTANWDLMLRIIRILEVQSERFWGAKVLGCIKTIDRYPPGNDAISHQTGSLEVFIDSKGPFLTGYFFNSQEGK